MATLLHLTAIEVKMHPLKRAEKNFLHLQPQSKNENVKYNFFQTIKESQLQNGSLNPLIFKERNYAYSAKHFIHTSQ